jgi:hypothetical protein
MHALTGIFGLILLVIVVADAFQTVIVARQARNLPVITRLLFRVSWASVAAAARLVKSNRRRDNYLGTYGPLSLLLLLGFWTFGLILAFAMLQWSVDLQLDGSSSSFANDTYFSAATLFSMGSGEPQNIPSKYLRVLEAGVGFSLLGLVIGYLPVLYQSFSNREFRILLLDARAGSPPSAIEFINRRGSDPEKLEERLADWEEWALSLLENHLSYPMLAYYRSHHANQSWLAALTAIVDVSALVMLGGEGDLRRQAEFTFAAGRHALAHTESLFPTRSRHPYQDRLPAEAFSRLSSAISPALTFLRPDQISEADLRKLRAMYEPHAYALGRYFLMALPPWIPSKRTSDNWQLPSSDR